MRRPLRAFEHELCFLEECRRRGATHLAEGDLRDAEAAYDTAYKGYASLLFRTWTLRPVLLDIARTAFGQGEVREAWGDTRSAGSAEFLGRPSRTSVRLRRQELYQRISVTAAARGSRGLVLKIGCDQAGSSSLSLARSRWSPLNTSRTHPAASLAGWPVGG
jgi:hypothetical protein